MHFSDYEPVTPANMYEEDEKVIKQANSLLHEVRETLKQEKLKEKAEAEGTNFDTSVFDTGWCMKYCRTQNLRNMKSPRIKAIGSSRA